MSPKLKNAIDFMTREIAGAEESLDSMRWMDAKDVQESIRAYKNVLDLLASMARDEAQREYNKKVTP